VVLETIAHQVVLTHKNALLEHITKLTTIWFTLGSAMMLQLTSSNQFQDLQALELHVIMDSCALVALDILTNSLAHQERMEVARPLDQLMHLIVCLHSVGQVMLVLKELLMLQPMVFDASLVMHVLLELCIQDSTLVLLVLTVVNGDLQIPMTVQHAKPVITVPKVLTVCITALSGTIALLTLNMLLNTLAKKVHMELLILTLILPIDVQNLSMVTKLFLKIFHPLVLVPLAPQATIATSLMILTQSHALRELIAQVDAQLHLMTILKHFTLPTLVAPLVMRVMNAHSRVCLQQWNAKQATSLLWELKSALFAHLDVDAMLQE
jgi:hypothetical protein